MFLAQGLVLFQQRLQVGGQARALRAQRGQPRHAVVGRHVQGAVQVRADRSPPFGIHGAHRESA
jgi:hypothetical protein